MDDTIKACIAAWAIMLVIIITMIGATSESQHSHGTGAEPVGLYP